jgi:copper chaperone CopZ
MNSSNPTAQTDAPLETKLISITGMQSRECVDLLENTLRGMDGVIDVSVDLAAELAKVTFDTSKTHLPDLHDAVLQAGYKPSGLTE